jgi:oligosaccharide repeat unit polymerase
MTNNEYYYIPAFLLLIILVHIIVGRLINRFTSPINFWNVGWMVLFLFALIFGSPYYYSIYALTLMTLGCISFSMGGIVSNLIVLKKNNPLDRSDFLSHIRDKSIFIQVIAVIIGSAGAIDLSNSFGTSLLDFSSIEQISSDASGNVAQLYSGEMLLTPLANFSFSALQLGFLFNGVFIAINGLKNKISISCFCLLFLTSLLWTSVTTTRSYFVVSMVWWLAAYYATKIAINEEKQLFNAKTIIRASFSITAVVILIIFVQSMRLGNLSFQQIDETLQHMRPWVAGYIPGFSVWVEEDWSGDFMYGVNFIRPIAKIFGITLDESDAGSVIPVDIGNMQQSNALTIYRVLFYDFGFFGSLVFTFLLGFCSQLSYRLCKAGSYIGWALLISCTTMIIWAPNFWFYNYGSRILVLILIILIAYNIQKRFRS